MPTPSDRFCTYRMLGRTVRVEFDDTRGAKLLREELSLYPLADESVDVDLVVRYRPVQTSASGLVNPSVHDELEDGFVMRHSMADVRFYLDKTSLTRVDFYPAASPSRVVAFARKMLDMQFSSREERAGVAFHELVMVPAAHWMSDLVVVHASGFSDAEGRVTLIGGTGGVGKTSLELELCLGHGYEFVADDISFVSKDGDVWPNLAYPKIYAYNLEDNSDLASRVLSKRGLADRVHWTTHRSRGASFVRRRLGPDVLYGSYNARGGRLSKYALLVRENRPNIEAAQIDARRAAAMSVSLMPPEYFQFYNHLHWHAFNRSVSGREPSVTVGQIMERWQRQLAAVLEHVSCLLVRIPVSMDHHSFKSEMTELLTQAA